MNRVIIPSFKANLPSFAPKDMGDDDIAIQFSGSWYLVGEIAQMENPTGERMQHGDFSSKDIQLMVQAATAKAIGRSGTIETDVVVAAPLESIDQFRIGPGKTQLKEEQFLLLEKTLSEIIFRDGNTASEPKVLKIKIKNAHVVNELSAVLQVIPQNFKRYGLIQWGHGDLQMVGVNEGTVVGDPYSTKGLWSAVRQFIEITRLKPAEGLKAFRDGYRYNGSMTDKISCEQEIERSIEHHIMTDMAPIMNNLAKQNQKNIIVSGGSAHNHIAMRLLENECKGRKMNLYRISDLEGVDVDPIYTCLEGLSKFGSLALDIGHSSLKASMKGIEQTGGLH